MSGSPRLKAQVSFELIIILAVALLISSVILSDFFQETSASLMVASIKETASTMISQKTLTTPSCSGAHVQSVIFYNTTVNVSFYKCNISDNPVKDAQDIADVVDKNICNNIADHNNIIVCGGRYYIVNVV